MNRESIKWAPFESLFKTSSVIDELEHKKEKHQKPVLSEDELLEIETNLLTAYHTKEMVVITYYYQGLDYQKKGIIANIKQNKVYFQDHTSLYFEQILKIKEY